MAERISTRRNFLKTAAAGSALTAATLGGSAFAVTQTRRQWLMVTAWPDGTPGIGNAAGRLAERIERLTEGRITVQLRAMPDAPESLFNDVASGQIQGVIGSGQFWADQHPGAAFFSTLPMGLDARGQDAWLYYGGGLKLWQKFYEPFGLVAFPAGNLGACMGGWFTTPLEDLADVKGLNIRLPGLAPKVLEQMGATVHRLPASGWMQGLRNARLDAVEGMGLWHDLEIGLHRAAKHLYGPGIHAPGTMVECLLNHQAFFSLSREDQLAIKVACATENQLLQSQFQTNNQLAFVKLRDELGITPRRFPDDVLKQYRLIAEALAADIARENALTRKIHDSYAIFRKGYDGYREWL